MRTITVPETTETIPGMSSVPESLPASLYGHNPFDPRDSRAYAAWREVKLARRLRDVEALRVRVGDPARLTADETASILERCKSVNMALYDTGGRLLDKAQVRALGACFGLRRLDGNLCADGDKVTALEVSGAGRKGGYIPYTNRRLSWHTDGYYNSPAQLIRAFILHCVRPAAEGGESLLLDPELVYIQLRDEDPEHIGALMDPEAMTIPPNIENGVEIRGARSGPVFSVDTTGTLHMRFSARMRNILWKDDPRGQRAAARLRELCSADNPFVYRYRLRAGEGVICNNVLHCRTGFTDPDDGEGRLLYRARYHDRIRGTAFNEIHGEP